MSDDADTTADPATAQSATRSPSAIAAEARRTVRLLDLTSLGDDDTEADIEALCTRANTPAGPVAAVCIWPRFVTQAREQRPDDGIAIATVINFPGGRGERAAIVDEAEAALGDGAEEIDLVLPYEDWLAGRRDAALDVVRAVRETTMDRALLKLILETGRLDDDAIAEISREAIGLGVDFLKTSTGKTDTSATPAACRVMLEAIRRHAGERPVGLKPSGGIRSIDDARRYTSLAEEIMGVEYLNSRHFRIGASSLLDALLSALHQDAPGAPFGRDYRPSPAGADN